MHTLVNEKKKNAHGCSSFLSSRASIGGILESGLLQIRHIIYSLPRNTPRPFPRQQSLAPAGRGAGATAPRTPVPAGGGG